MSHTPKVTPTACEQFKVEFVKSGGMWQSKIKGVVVLTQKQEGACKRNTEKYLTAHDGYYAQNWK